ncbi:Hypothetical predicted protein [Cloeon dipterum]|uniref:Exocyst complex component 7 n=1 Tax=Cloeon dipterum TaxID=197152 RepID=A0A8S1CUB1_9INSE|nr:Hypothetical predicted protein [Cloeon dipterum]
MQVQRKLEQELNNLNILKDKVNKSNQITTGMVNILSSFEDRLAKLEATILPVYNETRNLQRLQENIDYTMVALDSVIGYYSVSQEVEDVIRDGPRSANEGDFKLEPFLAAMNRLQVAKEYFQKNNPQSVELDNVISLLTAGGDALNREFTDILHKHSKHVPPIVLLDLVGTGEDASLEDMAPPSLNQLPDEVTTELIRIADWLFVNNKDEFMFVYAQIRAKILFKSLHTLKEQQRSSSGGSLQSYSPLPRHKLQNRLADTPGRKGPRKLQALEKASKMFHKASQTLGQSTGLSLGPRRSGVNLEVREDVVDEQEMENYLVCVMALQKLLLSERALMTGIIPLAHHPKVFEVIMQESMDMVVQDGENIATRAKRCISRKDFGAVLVVYPILKNLLNMRPEFEKTFEGCDLNVRSKFTTILNTLHATGAKALEEFIENVHGDSSSQLPSDGTVHELTSNVLMFLEQLTDYTETIGGILAQDPAYMHTLAAAPGRQEKNRTLLGIYIKKVLAQLNHTLVSKSEAYTDLGLRAIFRLNNNQYVLSSLQRSGLLDLVKNSVPDFENNYHEMISDNKTAYANNWSRVLNHINIGEEVVAVQMGGKMRDKDRNTVKEKFAGFNKDIEEMSKQQRGYSIPDDDVRQALIVDNIEMILPKYKMFYNKYSHLPFTKNKEKYIKYTPQQVQDMLERFFDLAA